MVASPDVNKLRRRHSQHCQFGNSLQWRPSIGPWFPPDESESECWRRRLTPLAAAGLFVPEAAPAHEIGVRLAHVAHGTGGADWACNDGLGEMLKIPEKKGVSPAVNPGRLPPSRAEVRAPGASYAEFVQNSVVPCVEGARTSMLRHRDRHFSDNTILFGPTTMCQAWPAC